MSTKILFDQITKHADTLGKSSRLYHAVINTCMDAGDMETAAKLCSEMQISCDRETDDFADVAHRLRKTSIELDDPRFFVSHLEGSGPPSDVVATIIKTSPRVLEHLLQTQQVDPNGTVHYAYEGDTPYVHVACSKSDPATTKSLEILLAYGAKQVTTTDLSAVEIALFNSNYDALRLLSRHGYDIHEDVLFPYSDILNTSVPPALILVNNDEFPLAKEFALSNPKPLDEQILEIQYLKQGLETGDNEPNPIGGAVLDKYLSFLGNLKLIERIDFDSKRKPGRAV